MRRLTSSRHSSRVWIRSKHLHVRDQAGVDEEWVRPEPTVWGDRLPFGTICGEFSSPNGGWVHDVAFSPSGDVLAYVSE